MEDKVIQAEGTPGAYRPCIRCADIIAANDILQQLAERTKLMPTFEDWLKKHHPDVTFDFQRSPMHYSFPCITKKTV